MEKSAVNVSDVGKNTPLHYAAQEGWNDIVQLLLGAEASLGRDRAGRHASPLHLACMHGHFEVVKTLVAAGADLDARCKFEGAKDMTPIAVWAASSNKAKADLSDLEIGRWLIAEHRVSVRKVQRLVLADHGLEQVEYERDLLPFIVPLRYLDLRNNKLQSVPQEMSKFRELKTVRLSGNPLETIPRSFREWPRLKEYLVSLERKATRWQERKILFVGRPGVGKTTLLRCFKERKHKVSCQDNISTDGITIERNLSLAKDTDIVFNAWDLGGQEVFYPTHQFFLTSNCFYVVAFDLTNVRMHRIDYWMLLLRTLGRIGDPPPTVILVGTHLDKVSSSEAEAVLNDIAQKYPAYRFPGLKEITAVSCYTGAGIPELMATISRLAEKDTFNADISVDWVKLHDFIRAQSAEYVDWSTYVRWADQCGVQPDMLPIATEFFRDMGSVIHFNHEGLRDLVVLSPQWLADVMSSLITFRHAWAKDGRLHSKDLHHVFMKHDEALQQQLLALLERFSIIFPMRADERSRSRNMRKKIVSAISGHTQEAVDYLVPSLLPTEPAEPISSVWSAVLPPGQLEQGRVYEFPFMPIGFASRFVVYSMHIPAVEGLLFWRGGLVLALGEQTALVQYDHQSYKLTINVRFPEGNLASTSTSLLTSLVEITATVLECFYPRLEQGLCVLVPCSHCYRLRSPTTTPFMFTYQECVAAAQSGEPFLYCHRIVSPARCVRLSMLASDVAMCNVETIAPSSLTVTRELGKGGFGTVYFGHWRGLDVAVKQLSAMEGGDETEEEAILKFKEFQQEVWVMSKLDHPCLTKLYGITIKPLQMVMEFAPLGDLSGLLRPKQRDGRRGRVDPQRFPLALQYAMLVDIARAMRYLHSINPPVIHRDLRSPNVFLLSLELDAPVRCQVADFGLSRGVAGSISGLLKTWQWLAPEVIDADSSTYNETADTYSFAVVAWEILTLGEMPYDEYLSDARYSLQTLDGEGNEVRMFQEASIKHAIIHDSLRPTFPATVDKALRRVLEKCWHTRPKERPSFAEVLKVLASVSGRHVPSARKDVRAGHTTEMSTGVGDTLSHSLAHSLTGEEEGDEDGEGLKSVAVDRHAVKVVTEGRHDPSFSVASFESKIQTRAQRIFCLLAVGDRVWLGGNDGFIGVYDAKSMKELHSWTASARRVYSLLATRAGHVWSGAEDGAMAVWNAEDHAQVAEWKAHPAADAFLKCLVVVEGESSQEVWAGLALQQQIRIFSAETFELLRTIDTSANELQGGLVCMTQRDNEVWVGTRGHVMMYRADLAVCVATFPLYGDEERERDVHVILPLGERRVWTALDTDIRVLEVHGNQLRQLATLRVHTSKVYCLGVWGKYVCSGSFDKSIILWDKETFEPVQELRGQHADSVRALMIRDECMWSAALDGTVCRWR
eukprot:TRINITY_DN6032_c0_g1_i1.p1 TRINITY_DN6032_c0_g1~~TRINITY_DN6032_c0_g1_i1.p1  ORF type:complete len:1495 (+),score=611.24 TRINITY_DN6032_c0_g1_i1:260-4486(+)